MRWLLGASSILLTAAPVLAQPADTANGLALAERLQAAGIAAGPVHDLGDLHDDPQLAHRAHFQPVEHAVLGRHPAETHAMRFSDMAPTVRRAAPRLGEHTDVVLRDILGMVAGEIAALRDAGALE